jgi:hypothetical protein
MDRSQLKMKYGDEQVLVVPAALMTDLAAGVQAANRLESL